MKHKNRKKVIILISFFMFFQTFLVLDGYTVSANNDPSHTVLFPANNSTTDINPLISCTVVDTDGDDMNATWYYNTYNDTVIIDEDCSTFNPAFWDKESFNATPEVWNDCWYFNVSAGINKYGVAARLLDPAEVCFGYYYIKFKTNEIDQYVNYALAWWINITTGAEVDMFEVRGGNTPGSWEFNVHEDQIGTKDSGTWCWVDDYENDSNWHEMECIYEPNYSIFRFDDKVILNIEDGHRANCASYFTDKYFESGGGMYIISFGTSSNVSHFTSVFSQLIVDHIRISTGTWHQYEEDYNVATGTNISHVNTGNFTGYNDTYLWRLNVSDGMGGFANETYVFHTLAQPPGEGASGGGDLAYGVSYGVPSPVNSSTGNSLGFQFSNSMNSNYVFNWTMECSNGDTSSGNTASNGTKTLTISSLSYSTTYTVWINSTDNDTDYYRVWFTFTTTGPPGYGVSYGVPAPVNSSTDRPLDFIYRIGISSNYDFNWTMTCSNGDTSSGSNVSNGTKELTLISLSYNTSYTIWVNSTDNSTDYYRVWFTFTTEVDNTETSTSSNMNNWTYIMENFIEWSTQGYEVALNGFFWPLIFTAVIGYVYIKQQSLVAAAVVTLIIFAAFFNAIVQSMQPWINFFYIGVSLTIAMLFLFLFLKRRVR